MNNPLLLNEIPYNYPFPKDDLKKILNLLIIDKNNKKIEFPSDDIKKHLKNEPAKFKFKKNILIIYKGYFPNNLNVKFYIDFNNNFKF